MDVSFINTEVQENRCSSRQEKREIKTSLDLVKMAPYSFTYNCECYKSIL